MAKLVLVQHFEVEFLIAHSAWEGDGQLCTLEQEAGEEVQWDWALGAAGPMLAAPSEETATAARGCSEQG